MPGVQGVQVWTVPKTATYVIIAAGARSSVAPSSSWGSWCQNSTSYTTYIGGAGAPWHRAQDYAPYYGVQAVGLGVVAQTTTTLTQGDTVAIVVGQPGVDPILGSAGLGGGGGSFVFSYPSGHLLLAAGGGGGGSNASSYSSGVNGTGGGGMVLDQHLGWIETPGGGVGGFNGSGGGGGLGTNDTFIVGGQPSDAATFGSSGGQGFGGNGGDSRLPGGQPDRRGVAGGGGGGGFNFAGSFIGGTAGLAFPNSTYFSSLSACLHGFFIPQINSEGGFGMGGGSGGASELGGEQPGSGGGGGFSGGGGGAGTAGQIPSASFKAGGGGGTFGATTILGLNDGFGYVSFSLLNSQPYVEVVRGVVTPPTCTTPMPAANNVQSQNQNTSVPTKSHAMSIKSTFLTWMFGGATIATFIL